MQAGRGIKGYGKAVLAGAVYMKGVQREGMAWRGLKASGLVYSRIAGVATAAHVPPHQSPPLWVSQHKLSSLRRAGGAGGSRDPMGRGDASLLGAHPLHHLLHLVGGRVGQVLGRARAGVGHGHARWGRGAPGVLSHAHASLPCRPCPAHPPGPGPWPCQPCRQHRRVARPLCRRRAPSGRERHPAHAPWRNPPCPAGGSGEGGRGGRGQEEWLAVGATPARNGSTRLGGAAVRGALHPLFGRDRVVLDGLAHVVGGLLCAAQGQGMGVGGGGRWRESDTGLCHASWLRRRTPPSAPCKPTLTWSAALGRPSFAFWAMLLQGGTAGAQVSWLGDTGNERRASTAAPGQEVSHPTLSFTVSAACCTFSTTVSSCRHRAGRVGPCWAQKSRQRRRAWPRAAAGAAQPAPGWRP